jgi:hypothetical protein
MTLIKNCVFFLLNQSRPLKSNRTIHIENSVLLYAITISNSIRRKSTNLTSVQVSKSSSPTFTIMIKLNNGRTKQHNLRPCSHIAPNLTFLSIDTNIHIHMQYYICIMGQWFIHVIIIFLHSHVLFFYKPRIILIYF